MVRHEIDGIKVAAEIALARGEAIALPIFLTKSPKGEHRITLHETPDRISHENRSLIPSGVYQLHVFDTEIEANAAATVLEGMGYIAGMERGSLPGGEGLFLARTGDFDPSQDRCGAVEAGCCFVGSGGMVRVSISDNRFYEELDVMAHAPLQIVLSLAVSARSIQRASAISEKGYAYTERRGRLLSSIVSTSAGSAEQLRACQRHLSNVPGALVSPVSLSVEVVNEALDDLGHNGDDIPESHDAQVFLTRNIGLIQEHGDVERAAEEVAGMFIASGFVTE